MRPCNRHQADKFLAPGAISAYLSPVMILVGALPVGGTTHSACRAVVCLISSLFHTDCPIVSKGEAPSCARTTERRLEALTVLEEDTRPGWLGSENDVRRAIVAVQRRVVVKGWGEGFGRCGLKRQGQDRCACHYRYMLQTPSAGYCEKASLKSGLEVLASQSIAQTIVRTPQKSNGNCFHLSPWSRLGLGKGQSASKNRKRHK